ncbi:MAG: hypothetical protein H6624_01460 [Bdellovibrionaceae bacterium]|nr:hypothetical protein [Bdellovibrionales bacterium]MCB9082975.1 hypothetical protein [Pseudobdellovibrionaceae bacterium]
MKRLSIALFVATFGLSAFAVDYIPSKTGDYCKDQIVDYMQTKFGADVQLSEWGRMKHAAQGDFTYWVTSNKCTASFYFRVPVNELACELAHYWYVPKYVHSVYTEGDCLSLLPEEVYIRDEDLTEKHRP